MHFPRYWSRGRVGDVICWRWSDVSEADAKQSAETAARRGADAFARGEPLNRYGYSDRPMREPVLEELRDSAGRVAGAITCNGYGATVLNTAFAMFVDVDLPETQQTAPPASPAADGGFFGRLFGPPAEKPFTAASAEQGSSAAEGRALARIEAWTAGQAGWGWRVYRTAAGLRLLATHALFAPESAATVAVFEALGADPLYRKLCRAQKSFRARLSPKPWRLTSNPGRPPAWPWASERIARDFDRWHSAYAEAARAFATCRLVRTVGAGTVHPDLQAIVRLHDEHTRVGTNLPLA